MMFSLIRYSHRPAVGRIVLPSLEDSPVGCFSWWGQSAPAAVLKPPQSVHTGLHSGVQFPSRGSVEEHEKKMDIEKSEVEGRWGVVNLGIIGIIKSQRHEVK